MAYSLPQTAKTVKFRITVSRGSGLVIWSGAVQKVTETSQIPQCTCPISHNTPLWNRNVHISVPMWCTVGYGTGALWDLWDRSILRASVANDIIVDWTLKPVWKNIYLETQIWPVKCSQTGAQFTLVKAYDVQLLSKFLGRPKLVHKVVYWTNCMWTSRIQHLSINYDT